MTFRHLLVVAAAIGLFFSYFGPLVLGDQTFGFRDAANYYYPLFEWEQREWGAGRIPVWNSADSCGVPILADATSSVLYPGKLLFALPISFRLSYVLYICGHVLLATGSVFWMTRRWGVSIEAAAVAGLSYGFGGVVLFQCFNVVFLVGAAWLPLAFALAEQTFQLRCRCRAIGVGMVLAIMTLGGDPQCAYHAGLAAVLCAFFQHSDIRAVDRGMLRSKFALLSLMAISGLLFAAVQILPSIEWARHSDRAVAGQARSVYDLLVRSSQQSGSDAQSESVSPFASLIGRPERGTHAAHIYQFSTPPWELLGSIWPNCFGSIVPANQRWITALPATGRTWTPSVYFGLLPLLAALASWRLFSGDHRGRWLSWTTLLFLVGSFGIYGLGWLTHELRYGIWGSDATDLALGEQTGGLYWWMVTCLPFYDLFRYPAKLLVVAALGASLLAALGWDRAVAQKSPLVGRALLGVAVASCLLLVAFQLGSQSWRAFAGRANADTLFGPLDTDAAARELTFSLLHALAIAFLLWSMIRWCHARWRPTLVLLTVVLELGIANHRLIVTVPGSLLTSQQTVADAVSGDPTYRVVRGRIAPPPAWAKSSSPRRMSEVVAWEYASLHPRYHLINDIPLVRASTTLQSAEFAAVARLRQRIYHRGDIYESFSAKYQLTDRESDEGSPLAPFDLVKNGAALPRAWIVREIVYLDPLVSRNNTSIRARAEKVFTENGALRDLRSVAFVESEHRHRLDPASSNGGQVEILEAVGGHLSLRVRTESNCLLVLNDAYYPGWHADVSTDQGTPRRQRIFRTNLVMRGVFLPAGDHRVVMQFSSQSFHWGAGISSCAWLLATFALWQRRRDRSAKR